MKPPSHPIPLEALDERLGFIGTAGSGKTYNAGTGVERLLQSNARVVIVDPLGVWWGLRLKADGKTPSAFNVAIFGGPHGDLPLNEHSGALIGETAATMAESCIVDLSEFGSKAADRRFMAAFLETIYRKASGATFHLVVDEADLFAPQKPQKGDEVLLGHMENIVRRGRIKGFIPWLISQRPAVLNKNVLSQVDGLIAFMLTASHDRAALDSWIEGQADPGQGKQIKDALPTLPVGTGVVWLPRRAILKTAAFPPKITFDSSRTPKRGEKRQTASLKPLDLDKLKGRLASIEEEAKASDPKALKARIAQLERELRMVAKPAPEPQKIDEADLRPELRLWKSRAEEAEGKLAKIAKLAGTPRIEIPAGTEIPAGPGKIISIPREPAPTGGPGQRILNSLAWWKALGHDQPSNEQVAFIAGYSHNSTGYTNPRGALKMAGLVEYPASGRVCLTEAGEAQAEAPDAPPSGEELRRRVLGKIAGPQQRILGVLIEAYPDGLWNEDCAAKAGYSHNSTGYTNPRGNLKTLNLATYPMSGRVRAADWLFPVRAK